MSVPAILLIASVALGAFSSRSDAPEVRDLLYLGFLTGIAALVLLLRAALARRKAHQPWIVLDGSNVMHSGPIGPSLDAVRFVIDRVRAQGLEPVIWFDANVGYKIGDRYLGPAALARRLGCAKDRVHVAPKGTPADPLLLEHAVKLNARVVSNDRFRDWQVDFPDLGRDDFLVPIRSRDRQLTLDL